MFGDPKARHKCSNPQTYKLTSFSVTKLHVEKYELHNPLGELQAKTLHGAPFGRRCNRMGLA